MAPAFDERSGDRGQGVDGDPGRTGGRWCDPGDRPGRLGQRQGGADLRGGPVGPRRDGNGSLKSLCMILAARASHRNSRYGTGNGFIGGQLG